MSVSLRAAVLGASMLALSPIPAHAAAIVSGLTGTPCGALGGPSTSCTVFDVDPFTTVPFSGQFEFDNDVALFAFVLTGQTTFSVATNSYAAGGFDPTIGLFLQNGTIVQYPDPNPDPNPAVPVAFYPAYGVDVDPDPNNPNYDDILPTLLLDPGTYYLALIEYGNFFKSDLNGLDSLRAGFASDDFAGAIYRVSYAAP